MKSILSSIGSDSVTDGNEVRALCAATLPWSIVCALLLFAGCSDGVKNGERLEAVLGGTVDAEPGVVQATLASSTDWPQLFGPERNCFSTEQGLDTHWPAEGPREVWRVAIGTGYSSPVVSGNKLIVMHRQGDEEIIQCFDSKTGTSHWQFKYPTNYVCKYEYSNGPYSTPQVVGDCVYAIGAQAQLRCLNLEDGTERWYRDLQSEFNLEEQLFGFGASPWIEGDQLILNVGASPSGAGIVAFDCQSGKTLWTATDHRASYATPIATTLHGERYLFVFTYDGLVALNPLDGTVRWIEPFKSKSIDTVNATSPAIWQDMVVVMHGPGAGAKCFRINADGSHDLVWKDRRVLDSQFNSLLSHAGYLYGFTAKRAGGAAFRCIDFATGKLQWSVNSELQRGSCVATRDRIILWGEEGHLAAIDMNPVTASELTITASSLLEKPCYAAPALAAKTLYLRNESYLIALDLSTNQNNFSAKPHD
jgi:outer membrane protein assembly factor BamB